MHAAIQIVVGVVVTILVYLISLWILRRDQLITNPSKPGNAKQRVMILDGYAEASLVSGTQWSTVNQNAQNYVMLDRSYNRKGGAQFSYSLWVQIRDTSVINGQTLFMRGDPTIYNWTKQVGSSPPKSHGDVMMKCPRVRFNGPFSSGLVLEFNTLGDPLGGNVLITPNPDPIPVTVAPPNGSLPYDETMRHNAWNLIQDRWAMFTFTLEDGISINSFENGITVRFYLNDMLYSTQSVQGALRQNVGDVYLLPTIKSDPNYSTSGQNYTAGTGSDAISNSTVGNFAYFNYALGLEQVRNIFHMGPPKKPATYGVGPVGETLYLSEYNKLDIYNS